MQKPLQLKQGHHFHLEDFCWPDAQAEKVFKSWFGALEHAPSQQLLVVGASGTGKTHLMLGTVRALRPRLRTVYSNVAHDGVPTHPIEAELVCLDHLDVAFAEKATATALVAFIDAHRAQGRHLILGIHAQPSQGLADLRTRLHLGLVLALHSLAGERLQEALQKRAHRLGIRPTKTLLEALCARYADHPHRLFSALLKLDELQLVTHKRLDAKAIEAIESDLE